jgi:hypothetical protein
MPIGSGANYQPANIRDWTAWGVFIEENWIINTPNAPRTNVYWSDDLWGGGSRCNPEGGIQLTVPLPSTLVIEGASGGNTPNNAAAILDSDGRTYRQTQPLTHCTTGSSWTTGYVQPAVDIYGDGILGGQGGSHMSSIGGAIRLGEFAAGRIPHALKVVLDSSNYSSSSGPGCSAPGCRWPAITSDCGSTACGYSGSNSRVKMGTLLALPTSFNCNGLRTVPGRIVCRAFQDYGAYIVDSGWDPAYMAVEYGPNGNVPAEFENLYGFEMHDSNANSAWSLDWRQMVTSSMVVDNNSSSSIGGGGTPRVPLAPAIGN